MRWDDVRGKYKSCWVVLEVLKARAEGKKRILEEVAVINTFQESEEALRSYLQLHESYPDMEFYVVHTDRPILNIEETRWMGIRTG